MTSGSNTQADILLAWYDRHARNLPWRVSPKARRDGERPDPYHVWLSEVMLQQTTVAAVKSYYMAFVTRWPTVTDLAKADTEDVMKEWAGLGYYSRARNLKKCAEVVATDCDGIFPNTSTDLQKLPGIGPYTSAAIAAIAFDEPAAVVDGNVERVLARLFRLERPLPEIKPQIKTLMGDLMPAHRPGDFAQAVMDLGATLCSPRSPACTLCPWQEGCEASKAGVAETLPMKGAKKAKPTRHGVAFVARRASDGAVLLRKRPTKGLLGGMSEVPGSDWTEFAKSAERPDGTELLKTEAPFKGEWHRTVKSVRHTFTHFHLELDVFTCTFDDSIALPDGWWWSTLDDLQSEALPTLMRKAIAAALP